MSAPRPRLAVSISLAALVVSMLAASARAESLLIVSPPGSTEVEAGYAGPVEVAWSQAGSMRLAVEGPDYSFTLAPITVTDETLIYVQQYAIDPLTEPGAYTISVGPVDGPFVDSVSVTVPPPNDVSLLRPGDGQVTLGWQGPIRLRWNSIAHQSSSYVVGLDGLPVCAFPGGQLAAGTVTNCHLDWVPEVGPHFLSVEEAGRETFLLTTITVEPPALSLLSLTLRPQRFYPYIHDGYRDRTVLRFSLNKKAAVAIKVRNANGKIVRRIRLGVLATGTWRWDGRSGNGSLVPPGRYKLKLRARTPNEVRRWRRCAVAAVG